MDQRRLVWVIRRLERLFPLLVAFGLFTTLILSFQLGAFQEYSNSETIIVIGDRQLSTRPQKQNEPPKYGSISSSTETVAAPPPSPPLSTQKRTKIMSQPELWSENSDLPTWIQDYFHWHRQQMDHLNSHPEDWTKSRYLILRCTVEIGRCGGLSDRLKPIPLTLLSAYQSQRILFIYWTRPFPLEEFLVPKPHLSINWTIPEWLQPSLFQNESPESLSQGLSWRTMTRASMLIETCMDVFTVVHTHLHDAKGGSTQYDEVEGVASFDRVYHSLFQALFTPSPPIQSIIDQYFVTGDNSNSVTTAAAANISNSANWNRPMLIPGQYATAHYRVDYGREVGRHPVLVDPLFVSQTAVNALACASEIAPPGIPIYFASDSIVALTAVREFADRKKNRRPIITFPRQESKPFHLDVMEKEANEQNSGTDEKVMIPTVPSDYYSTFIDLFLAGNGLCVAFGRGGFGRFANSLSYNSSCVKKHVANFRPVQCQWRD